MPQARCNGRRRAADLVTAAAVVAGLYALHVTGGLAIWHVYVASAIAALAATFR